MRKFLPLLILLSFFSISGGFAAIPENQAIPGQVLIKLKPSFAYLNTDGKAMRSRQWQELLPSLSISRAEALSTGAGIRTKKSQARLAPQTDIDIRLYHQLSFDPGLSMDYALEQLYHSGIVELAEPVYAAVPLDFETNDPLAVNQYHLELIKAYEAWSLSQGSGEVVIAVLDTGIDLSHPDLAANIYVNKADPVDGVDNDGDGFLDNYYGWDFAGSDYVSLVGDNDPGTLQNNAKHGSKVAGCASAVTNNGVGIAGVSFNAKIMALKHMADNDRRANGRGYLLNVLQGVLYAATHGAHIINASYGSGFYSQIEQDIYKLVTVEYNVLVVAAAGNSGSATPNYPSDYPSVLSVAASTNKDVKAAISSYGYGVDLVAPGEQVYSTATGGIYEHGTGTSFAAPIVSGAAALIKVKHPELTAEQLGELLRVSSDPAFLEKHGPSLQGKLGSGRLDMASAMAYHGPAIRASNTQLIDAVSGTSAHVFADFKNLLWPTQSGLSVTLVSLSEGVGVLEPTIELGMVQGGEVVSNLEKPFTLEIQEGLQANFKALFRLEFSAGTYKDVQHIIITVNPYYLDLQENKIATTISGDGRLGYADNLKQQGQGFMFEGVNILHEMGVVMAGNQGKVVSNVRGIQGVDQDFSSRGKVRKALPGPVADCEMWGSFDDSGDAQNRLDLVADFRTYTWKQAPNDQSVLLLYTIRNTGSDTIKNYYMGVYADWDIATGSYKDKADWDSLLATGYVYSTDPANDRVGAIQLLSENPSYWAIDNDAQLAENPFGVYDGFTDEEKYRTLSNGLGRRQAGGGDLGSDVSHTVGTGPYTIPAGDSIVVAFALHAGHTLTEIKSAAAQAKLQYEQFLVAEDGEDPDNDGGGENPPGEDNTGDDNDNDGEDDNDGDDGEDGGGVTGVDTQEIVGLKLYPNPTNGKITLSLPRENLASVHIRILDSNGRQQTNLLIALPAEIQQIALPPAAGMYLLEIRQGDKRSLRRVVVQK